MAAFKSIFTKFKTWTKSGKRIAFLKHNFQTEDQEVIDHLRNMADMAKGRKVVVEVGAPVIAKKVVADLPSPIEALKTKVHSKAA